MQRVYNSICGYLDYPKEVTYVKKFLVAPGFSLSDVPSSVHLQGFTEIINYLNEEQELFSGYHSSLPKISCVKKRISSTGHTTHSYISRLKSEKLDERIELRRQISSDDYRIHVTRRDTSKATVFKQVQVFVYENG